VLVTSGADPTAALAAAGIFDPIAIPVVLSEAADLPAGMLGDGRTPNLRAVLEMDQQSASESSPGTQTGSARPAAGGAQPSGPVTATLPAAFGMKSLVPIRRSGATGQTANGASGPSPGSPPSSGRFGADGTQPSGPVTTTLPAAFGMKSLAPIRRSGDMRQIANGAAGAAWDDAGWRNAAGKVADAKERVGGTRSVASGGTGTPSRLPIVQVSQRGKLAAADDPPSPNVEDLARLITTEAGGEGAAAMTAVGWTVRNRMARNKTNVVREAWGVINIARMARTRP